MFGLPLSLLNSWLVHRLHSVPYSYGSEKKKIACLSITCGGHLCGVVLTVHDILSYMHAVVYVCTYFLITCELVRILE